MKTDDDAIDAWIDGLLTADEARFSAPAALHSQVRHLRNRKRRAIAACGFAAASAAAALAFVLIWPYGTSTDGRKGDRHPQLSIAHNQDSSVREPVPSSVRKGDRHPQLSIAHSQNSSVREPVPLSDQPVATFVGRGDLIVVPIESNDPTVTIMQVYPTTIAQRRWRRKAALEAILSNTELKVLTPVRGG